MSAFAGAQGYENLSSAKQQERSTAGLLDKGLVRNPSATPAHLSRVLHIPAHRNSEFHIRVYNVTSEYKHAIGYAPMGGSDIIGDALMGSRLFMTRLGTMKKPPMSLEDNEAQYAANAHVNANEVVVALRSLPEGSQGQNAVISLPSSTDDYKLAVDKDTDIFASFPILDTISSAGTTRHPFFTFSACDATKKLQWQIHPLESGPLRYTLVEINPAKGENSKDSRPEPDHIRAIYHNISQSPSLSLCHSEGILLLPVDLSNDSSVTEEVVVASLLGLLWRVRGMQVKPPAAHPSQSRKKSFLGRIFN